MALSQGGMRPPSGSVQQLSQNLINYLPQRSTALLNTERLAPNLETVMNGGRINATQVNLAINSSHSLLRLGPTASRPASREHGHAQRRFPGRFGGGSGQPGGFHPVSCRRACRTNAAVSCLPCRCFPRQPAGAPGGLEVVATDQTVEIQHLAGEVQTRHDPAFQGAGINLVECQAAAGHLGLLETERARNWQGQRL